MLKFIIIFLVSLKFLFSDTPGESVFNFLKISVSPKSSAMAEASTASFNDVFNLFYNPASIAYIDFNQIAISHLEYIENIRYENLAANFKIKEFYKVGIALGYLYTSDIPKTIRAENIEGTETIGYFGVYNILIAICNSLKISEKSSFGINLKYVSEKIDEYKSSTIAYDTGFSYRVSKNIYSGISILNMAPYIKFIEKKENLPLNFKFGIMVNIWNFNFNFDINKFIDNKIEIHSGTELKLFKRFFARAGYKYNFGKRNTDNFSAGCGIKFNKFNFDYAFVPYNFLGATHRIGISYDF